MTEEGARGKAGEGGKEEEGQGRIPPALGVDFAGVKGERHGPGPAEGAGGGLVRRCTGRRNTGRLGASRPRLSLASFWPLWLSCRFRGERSSRGERGFAVSDESRLQINRLC